IALAAPIAGLELFFADRWGVEGFGLVAECNLIGQLVEAVTRPYAGLLIFPVSFVHCQKFGRCRFHPFSR
ncbi:MAG: hypothetical protein ACR2QJ_08055, partial [Geminicoccaceae bacterium]